VPAPATIALARSKAVHVARNGAFDVSFAKLACPFSLPDRCTAVVTLLPASGRGRSLGTKTMTIAAGKTVALHAALNARALKALKRHGKLVVLVRIDAVHGTAAHARRDFRLTLLPPRRR
jgi:hypothetical protein